MTRRMQRRRNSPDRGYINPSAIGRVLGADWRPTASDDTIQDDVLAMVKAVTYESRSAEKGYRVAFSR